MKPTACLLLMLLPAFPAFRCPAETPRYTLTVLPLGLTDFDQVNAAPIGGGICGTRVIGMTTVHHRRISGERAALWQRGLGLRLLDTTPLTPADPHSSLTFSLKPTALNRFGAIVGYSHYSFAGAWSGSGADACLWPPGGKMHLAGYFPSAANAVRGFPVDTDSVAVAINDYGDLAGSVIFNNHDKTPDDNPPAAIAGTHAFVRHGGKVRLLWPGTARGISNRGWVVGLRDLGGGEDSHVRGALWRNGRTTLFKMQPSAISDTGEIAGSLPGIGDGAKACVWRRGRVTVLSRQNSRANALNARGQVVGAVKRATLWQNGRAYDLNLCVPLPKGWVLTNAIGINDNGWIIGEGSVYKHPKDKEAARFFTFLLTPR